MVGNGFEPHAFIGNLCSAVDFPSCWRKSSWQFQKEKTFFVKLKDLDYGCIDMFIKDITVLRIPSETLDYLSDGCKVPSSVTNSQHINLKLTQRKK